MPLVSWFKKASNGKRAVASTLLAVNALTFYDSLSVAHIHETTNTVDPSRRAGTIFMAPVITGYQWYFPNEASQSTIGETPVSFLANQTKKIFPKPVDTVVGVAVAFTGSAGAWAGFTAGTFTGIAGKTLSNLGLPKIAP